MKSVSVVADLSWFNFNTFTKNGPSGAFAKFCQKMSGIDELWHTSPDDNQSCLVSSCADRHWQQSNLPLKKKGNMQQTTDEKLVPIGAIASRLGISTRAVYRLVAKDEFPRPVKVGGATRFYWSDLEQYLDRLREQRATN